MGEGLGCLSSPWRPRMHLQILSIMWMTSGAFTSSAPFSFCSLRQVIIAPSCHRRRSSSGIWIMHSRRVIQVGVQSSCLSRMEYIWFRRDLKYSSCSADLGLVDDPHCINHSSRVVSWSLDLSVSSRSLSWSVLWQTGKSCVWLSPWGGPSGNKHRLSSVLEEVGVKVVLWVGSSAVSCSLDLLVSSRSLSWYVLWQTGKSCVLL